MPMSIALSRGLCAFCLALAAVPASTQPPPHPAPTRVQIASDVYVYMTPPYGAVGLDGNSVVVVSRDGVLVFDANGTPAAAAAVLRDLRTITDAPVRYIVYSHWHWDHWYGTEVYTAAFPDAVVIAHEQTRVLMAGPALAFNKPGLEQQLPAYVRTLEARVAAAEQAQPPPATLAADRDALAAATFFLTEKQRVAHVLPAETFTERRDLTLGGRRIQLRHFGRGVTPGDVVMYLPDERVLALGDVVVNPITFALSSYPSEWLAVLEQIDALDARTIVTGHGPPLEDEKLLHDTMAVFRALLREGRSARARGLDVDAARDEILPGLVPLRNRITGDVPARNAAFATQLVDWFLHRVYDELAGPLGNDIAPIPPR